MRSALPLYFPGSHGPCTIIPVLKVTLPFNQVHFSIYLASALCLDWFPEPSSNEITILSWAPKSLWPVTVAMKFKDACSLEAKLRQT